MVDKSHFVPVTCGVEHRVLVYLDVVEWVFWAAVAVSFLCLRSRDEFAKVSAHDRPGTEVGCREDAVTFPYRWSAF